MKIFYNLKHILYIAGSLRESCKILTKGFNKEFLPGCLTEHPVHYLVHFSAGISVRSYTGCWIHAVFLAEIFLCCCGLLLNGRERQLGTYIYMFTVMTLNTYLQGLPSNHQCRGFVQIYIYI